MVDEGIKSWLDSSQDHWLVCSQRLWYKWPKDPNYKEEERCWPSPKCKKFEIPDFSELFSTISGHLNCVLFFFFFFFFSVVHFLTWLCFWNSQILSKLRSLGFYTPPPSTTLLNSYLHRCLMTAWSSMTELVFCLPLCTSLIAQMVKNPLQMQNTWVPSLGWEGPLKKGMATLSSILA